MEAAATMRPIISMTTPWAASVSSLTIMLAGRGDDVGRVSCQDASIEEPFAVESMVIATNAPAKEVDLCVKMED